MSNVQPQQVNLLVSVSVWASQTKANTLQEKEKVKIILHYDTLKLDMHNISLILIKTNSSHKLSPDIQNKH